MRQWIIIVENAFKGDSVTPIGSDEWRESVLKIALDPDQGDFSAIQPSRSGLDRTIYLSGWDECPAIIVDSRIGKQLDPDENSLVYMIGEPTIYPDVNEWILRNLTIIESHQKQTIDTIGFLNDMVALNEEKLLEMPNWSRGRFNNPLAFFIRPEPNPLQHHARVKVNKNYRLGFTNNDSFSIALFPNAHKVESHDIGKASQKDVDGMVAWIEKNKNVFWDFYRNAMDEEQFDFLLRQHPYLP